MTAEDRALPDALRQVSALEFPYEEDNDVDYEPYERFEAVEETCKWFKLWTGNPDADGSVFRTFAQDGTGGKVAFWLTVPDVVLELQPAVFMGSEGERKVVASNLADFLWLLADGWGPAEAVCCPELDPRPRADIARIASHYRPGPPKSAEQVLAEAADAFPDFDSFLDAQTR